MSGRPLICATSVLLLFASRVEAQQPEDVTVTLRYSRPTSDVVTSTGSVEANAAYGAGIILDVRERRWIVRLRYEHDFASVQSLVLRGFKLDSGEFSRDRWEATAGYELSPYVSIEGGFRNERINFAEDALSGLGAVDTEFFALSSGLTVHTPRERAVSGALKLHGYYGGSGWSADRLSDTRGHRVELTVPVRLGRSAVRLVPGVALDRLRTASSLRTDERSYFIGIAVSTSQN